MESVLETGHSWILESVEYQFGCLCIVLKELFKAASPSSVEEGAPIDGAFAIKPSGNSRRVSIKFHQLITWQVINESCEAEEPGCLYQSHGYLAEVEESEYFLYVKKRFGWYSCISGEFRLFRVWSEHEIIEVVCSSEPEVSVL